MEYQDKVLKCAECGAEFIFTAGEQMFFADKGFKNEPKRCKSLQSKTRGDLGPGQRFPANRNQDDLLAVREGDDGPLQAYAGSPGLLPRMLPTAAVDGFAGLTARVIFLQVG